MMTTQSTQELDKAVFFLLLFFGRCISGYQQLVVCIGGLDLELNPFL